MTDVVRLRTAITGLLGFAAAEEEMLLTAGPRDGFPDGPERWGAVASLAHVTEFKSQQCARIRAVAREPRWRPAWPSSTVMCSS